MPEILSQLQRKLRSKDVEERCGVILKSGKILDCANVHLDPVAGFRIAGADLIKYEAELAGTWHTHPAADANLSQEDYAGFLAWPDLDHYIIGRDEGAIDVRKYITHDGAVLRA